MNLSKNDSTLDLLPPPPWQLWDYAAPGFPELVEADRLLAAGQYPESVLAYQEIEKQAANPRLREEAFVRKISTMLHMGQSKQVLDLVTQHLKSRSLTPENAPPVIALIVAYSYLHQQQFDQCLAWWGMVYAKINGQGILARRAISSTEQLLRSLPAEKFADLRTRWSADPFAGPLISREQVRRARSGAVVPFITAGWFGAGLASGATGTSADAGLGTDTGTVPTSKTVVGVLLPFTGKYAEHALRVRQGIELAFQQLGADEKLHLVFADTAGEPELAVKEYERLVQERAVFIFGPLLVRTAEEVAKKSEIVGVPFLTFTKRPGITELSRVAFRLGAVAKDQVVDLLGYAADELKLDRFSVLYPKDSAGEEFAAVFRQAISERQALLAAEAAYEPGNGNSMQRAANAIAGKQTGAVFIADTLDNSAPVLQTIKNSPVSSPILLGSALWDDPIALRGFGQLIDGAVYATPFFKASSQPQVVEFVNKYRDAYQRDPEILAAQGYDAARFVLPALLQPNSTSKPGEAVSFVKQINNLTSYQGVTGKLQMTENGEIARRMSVLQLHQGEVVEVMAAGSLIGLIPNGKQQTQEQEEKFSGDVREKTVREKNGKEIH